MKFIYENFDTHIRRTCAIDKRYSSLGIKAFRGPISQDDRQRITVILNKTREIPADVLERFPKLRQIIVLGSEDWMVPAAISERVSVRTLEADRGVDVAELAIGLMITGLKYGKQSHRARVRALIARALSRPAEEISRSGHNWTQIRTKSIYGKKVGILGYGLIGRQIHRRLAGFSCEVQYHHRTRYTAEIEKRAGLQYSELPQLFTSSDVVFIQLPLTETTRNLVNHDILASANPRLVLVNCGRAAVVDKGALYRRLARRKMHFYAADVFWREPMPFFDRFRLLNNCYLTPHLAESLETPLPNIMDLAIEELRDERDY